MTKVLLVAHWDWVLHNFRLPLARGLADGGSEVVLVCPRGRYSHGFAEQGFRWIEWKVHRRSLNPLLEWQSVRGLTRIYREQEPDVVHHFTIKPNFYGSMAARRAGVGRVLNTFTGLGFLFSEGLKARAIRVVVLPLMRRTFRSPHLWTVFQNRADMERVQDLDLVDPERSVLIEGTGVDTSRYQPTSRSELEVPIVLMAARLIREKGVADLVEASRLLAEAGVETRVWIAGEPDSGNPSAISSAELARWNAQEGVDFLGHQEDMADLFRQAHIAVLPTYYPEGVPRFLLEAAATGLPLVATDIPACREIVDDGVNGFLVPPRDAESLAGRLTELIHSAELRRRFGEAGRAVVERRFDEVDIVRRYLDLYESLRVLPA